MPRTGIPAQLRRLDPDSLGHSSHEKGTMGDVRDRHAGRYGPRDSCAAGRATAAVNLYWLPLGAGGRFVRRNGRVFEAVAARLAGRSACDLYHSALEVRVPDGRFVIEQAPVRDDCGDQRGVVAEGAVGSRWAGRFRIFVTRSVGGAMGLSRMSTRPLRARGD
jgi:hypothetical protein